MNTYKKTICQKRSGPKKQGTPYLAFEEPDWYKDVENTGFRAFNTIANMISLNYRSMLNYFTNRSTNASAESFNAKIKAFRAQFRGVKNVEFFLYRLTTIFA